MDEDRQYHLRHFGPMHGERTRRHQFVSTAPHGRETVVSVYESRPVDEDDKPEGETRCIVELTGDSSMAFLTLEEARWLHESLAEFIEAHSVASL